MRYVCGNRLIQFLMLAGTLVACLPENQPLPVDTGAVRNYEGFTGVSEAKTMGADKIRVTWNPARDSSVVLYTIYDASNFFEPEVLGTASASSSSVLLTGLTAQRLYRIRVRAVNAQQIEDTNIVEATAIPYGGVLTNEIVSSTSVKLAFNDGSSAEAIHVYCKTGSNPNWVLMSEVTNTSLTEATLSSLVQGTTYTCRAALSIGETVDNNDKTVVFTPMGQATKIVFKTQPGSANAGIALSPQPVVEVQDANNNVVSAGPDSSAVITLSLAATSPTVGSVRGTVSVSAVRGVATFTGINFQEAGIKALTATKPNTSSQTNGSAEMTVDSNTFMISPGAVSPTLSSLEVSPASGSVVANASSTYSVTITLKDQYGNAITGVRPQLNSTVSADTITQPSSNTSSLGVATAAIATPQAGSRTIAIASPAGLSAVQQPLVFIHGPATRLAFTTQPANSPAGVEGLNTVQVSIQDAMNNVVTTGASATSSVSLSIQNNVDGALLTGTTSIAAVGGVATFEDLGIDRTGNGRRLTASSGSLTFGQSNPFNVTAGVPTKVLISAPAKVKSGTCSAKVTVSLRDAGNNLAGAPSAMTIALAGMGATTIHLDAFCAGASQSANLSFSSGSSSRDIYFKNQKAEILSITGSDASGVLVQATHQIAFSPSKATFTGPSSVIAGKCSAAFSVTTRGENDSAGPVSAITPFKISGLESSSALFYVTNDCEGLPVNLDAVNVAANQSVATIYFKGTKAEFLTLNLSDPAEVVATTSTPIAFSVLASNINFTGPSSVVSGQCGAATKYTVQLRDVDGNAVLAPSAKTITINGLSGAARFYTSCAGTALGGSFQVPQNQSTVDLYFKNTQAGTMSVFMSDGANQLATSQTINISVSPSDFALVIPVAGSAKTSVCAGPFRVDTLDGAGTVTPAVGAINAQLSGQGPAGSFYSASGCNSTDIISQLSFASGQSTKNFWFKSDAPGVLPLTVADAAAVLNPKIANWELTAAPAWIGTAKGQPSWFQMGGTPVRPRSDEPRAYYALAFDPTKNWLYVADHGGSSIHRYDYQNGEYFGWIGRRGLGASTLPSGSNVDSTMAAMCASVLEYAILPGWCKGGLGVEADGWGANVGGVAYPTGIVADSTYLYVTNHNQHTVNRYIAATGEFAGWIGRVNATNYPTAPGDSTSNACDSSIGSWGIAPGWCKGGHPGWGGQPWEGGGLTAGALDHPRAIALSQTNGGLNDGPFIYVAGRYAVTRRHATTGAFMGWIGRRRGTAGTMSDPIDLPALPSLPPTYYPSTYTCSSTPADKLTPSWCMGGDMNEWGNPWDTDANRPRGSINHPTGLFANDATNRLYVVDHENGGWISEYNLQTGTFLRFVKQGGLTQPYAIAMDGDTFFLADSRRISKLNINGVLLGWIGKVLSTSGLGGTDGCDELQQRENTPGWCTGGTPAPGIDEGSLHQTIALAIDGNGKIVTADSNTPGMKRWDLATGAYEGQLIQRSDSPARWSVGLSSAPREGYDDKSMYGPMGLHRDGDFLYIAEMDGGRVKKVNAHTGEVVGWIGGMASKPTGGTAGCSDANAFSLSPGWCLGAWLNPSYLWDVIVSAGVDGILYSPMGVTTDATWVYVTDHGQHMVRRFNKDTGDYGGWIGWIHSSYPTTHGDPGCNGAANIFTPGWCKGGRGKASDGALNEVGAMYFPHQLVHLNGNLYVMDHENRLHSYVAATGVYNGWTGYIERTPTAGGTGDNCSGAYRTVTSGFCKGGRARRGNPSDASDHPGGSIYQSDGNYSGITTDGTYLYVSEGYMSRIDQFSAQGKYIKSMRTFWDTYTNAWSTNPNTWNHDGTTPRQLWANSTHVYAAMAGGRVLKFEIATGNIVGWMGAINPSSAPSQPAACSGVTTTTPTWCRFGASTYGYTMGGFVEPFGVTGDANFIYVSDRDTHRVTRLPK
jgi:hypothetical protein